MQLAMEPRRGHVVMERTSCTEVAVFAFLVLTETFACLLLAVAILQTLSDIAPAPELDLAQRAWAAARFGIEEAHALGPLFKHLARASRKGLRRAHRMQEHIRYERAQHEHPGV